MPKSSYLFAYTNRSTPWSRKEITIVWSTIDVQKVRPDLNTQQAWDVLQDCERNHDYVGVTWDLIKHVAEEFFPRNETGGRS